ncbi:hypothetical protein K3W76_14965, partial [Listeria monocytogenes]|nr:hypothetical protein [Listeria monocytogenes]
MGWFRAGRGGNGLSAMRQEFAYHRSLGPMIGVLLGSAIVERCGVQLVGGTLFGWTVALGVGVLDLSLVLG